jgi:hypothetical protein
MGVFALEDCLAATKDLKAVNDPVLASGQIGIEIRQSLFIQPDPRRCSFLPALDRPDDGRVRFGRIEADARERHGRSNRSAQRPSHRPQCDHLKAAGGGG